jgi:hypothetical protein
LQLFDDRSKIPAWKHEEREMPNAVIEDWDRFQAFLASQPFCAWSAQKQREIAMGMHTGRGGIRPPDAPAKDDNADLMAALASMA